MKKLSLNSMMAALVLSAVAASPVLAHDHRGSGHERINLNFGIAGTDAMFEVKMPVDPKLSYLKRKFMVRAGLVSRDEHGHHGHHGHHGIDKEIFDQYVVEHLVTEEQPGESSTVTVCASRGACTTTVTTGDPVMVETYVPLDETKSLKALGIADGDTLRLREL